MLVRAECISFVFQGFHDIIPANLIQMFDERELEVCILIILILPLYRCYWSVYKSAWALVMDVRVPEISGIPEIENALKPLIFSFSCSFW